MQTYLTGPDAYHAAQRCYVMQTTQDSLDLLNKFHILSYKQYRNHITNSHMKKQSEL